MAKDSGEEPPAKKEKVQKNYGTQFVFAVPLIKFLNLGTDASKWNQAKKADTTAAAELSKTNTEEDFEKREAIFAKRRDELTAAFKLVKF